MHDKLKLLLEQLKYNEDNYKYFKDGNLKIIINTNTKIHSFIFEIENILPLNAYLELVKKLKLRFKDYNTEIILKTIKKNQKKTNFIIFLLIKKKII